MSEIERYSFQGETGALPAIGLYQCRSRKFFAVAIAALLCVCSIVSPDSAAAVARQHCKLENGSVLIDADKIVGDTAGDNNQSTACSALGEVVVVVPGQDARIQADSIKYDRQTRTIEATGHARILKKGFDKKGERLIFVVAKPEPPREVSSMAEPIPGDLFDDRLSLSRCIKSAAKAGVNVSAFIPPYDVIENLVRKNESPAEVQAKLIDLRFQIAKELGSKELLVEQEYGNGPLSKLCREAEQSLRANCKFGTGFSDKVFVLCAVNQDGSFSRIAADDPAKYVPAVSALACEKVKALKLKSPGKDPVPLVISLSNKPELNIVYVSGINYDVYIAYLESHIKKQWHPTPSKTSKLVQLELSILRDGSIKTASVLRGCGVPADDKAALDAVHRAKPLKPLPDGSCEDLYLAFSLDYNVYTHEAGK
jgi:TonB family protein